MLKKTKIVKTPDNWIILKIHGKGSEPFYKVLAGWSGGYLDGDHWSMNSGIKSIEHKGGYYYIYGNSGSCYKCPVSQELVRMNISGVLQEVLSSKLEGVEVTQVLIKEAIDDIGLGFRE